MNSRYVSNVTRSRIWPDFVSHFQSETTAASYQADIQEIMDFFKMDFLEIGSREAEVYFERLSHCVRKGVIQPSTMAKKFRELHSFAEFICENRENYSVSGEYQDIYYPYLKRVAKQEKYTRSIPVEHIDRLLKAAEADVMAYTILVMLYRVGLSSTEIIDLKPDDFAAYDNGVYVAVEGRTEAVFVPEDVFVILEQYLLQREDHPYLFYNRRGNPLNLMYISRMLKKYTESAGIPSYSAESIRNTCGVTMFAYGAKPEQVARQMGVTEIQIHRYNNISYRENLQRSASSLVKLRVEPPI